MIMTDSRLRHLAWAIACFMLVVVGASAPLFLIAKPAKGQAWGGTGSVTDLLYTLVILLFPLVGLLIARQQPRNRIAWLLLGIGLISALQGALEAGLGYGVQFFPALPVLPYLGALDSGTWVLGIGLMATYLILLFPDGRLPSPRWRLVAWTSGLVIALIYLFITISPGPLDVGGLRQQNPFGLEALRPHLGALYAILALLPACIVACAVGLIVRFRRSTGVERLQLKWLATAGACVAAMYLVTMAATIDEFFSAGSTQRNSSFVLFLQALALVSFGLIPISIGIAVTRHGLYGIDALISRALVVGALGVFVTAVYVALVVGLGAVIGQRHPSVWLSILATAIVAVAFQPVRERVQGWSNRLVYGERATPYEVLSNFSSRMTGTYALPELLPQLAATLARGLGARRVEVWVAEDGRLVRQAAWPDGEPSPPAALPLERAGDLARHPHSDPSARTVPVRHHGDLLGMLSVEKPAGEPLTTAEQKVLTDVASQAGLVLRNVRLLDDIRASRERLVTTQDAERRRLERNLHDGAQQSLVSVALLLRMAAARIPTDLPDLSVELEQVAQQLQQAIDELRELARGIHPAILTERGLPAALQSLAERSLVPVALEAELDRRLPPAVEGTLYFVAAEALTNVAKYAAANGARVTLAESQREVVLSVSDDGVGGADPSSGSGLRGLQDRVTAVEGVLEVSSPPHGGTNLTCRVPLSGLAAPPRTEASPQFAGLGSRA